MRVAIFFTAGLSDLKFVSADGDLLELTKMREQPGGRQYASIREVHQALLELGAGRIALAPIDGEAPRRRGIGVGFLKGDAPPDRNPVGLATQDFALAMDEAGRLRMAADKLLPAWERRQEQRAEVVAVVGFATRRDDDPDEPIAAEALIFDKLVAAWTPRHSALVRYATGRERFEGGQGRPFAQAAKRIEDAVRECRRALDGPVEPWLVTSGGIPGAKEVIRAAVELHFGPAKTLLSRETRDGSAPDEFLRSPQDALVARRQALDFVRRGALREAAAVTYSFRDERGPADRLALPCRCAARFLEGNPVRAYAWKKHPTDAERWETQCSFPEFIFEFARSLNAEGVPLRSVLVGLRAESALRSHRWLDAVNLTTSFFDAVLADTIERRFGTFDEDDDRLLALREPLGTEDEARLVAQSPLGRPPTPAMRACLSRQEDGRYLVQTGGLHDGIWCAVLGPEIESLRKALRATRHKRLSIRDARNKNTHNLLTDQELADLLEDGPRFGVWSHQYSLFDARLPSAVLRALGFTGNPFDELLRQLERQLLQP